MNTANCHNMVTQNKLENLDLACARVAQEIAKITIINKKNNEIEDNNLLENTIRDASGVLETHGVYALFLYLSSKKNKKSRHNEDINSKQISEKPFQDSIENQLKDILFKLLKENPKNNPLIRGDEDIFKSLEQIAQDLNKLFMAFDLLKQCLVYARYHVEAKDKENKNPGNDAKNQDNKEGEK